MDSRFTPREIKELMQYATPEEKVLLEEYIDGYIREEAPIFVPQSGPQRAVFESDADVIGVGGSAGGGKTAIICGLALTKHTKSLIIRRESVQLRSIKDTLISMVGSTKGLNEQLGIWKNPVPGKSIEFGYLDSPGDEENYRGRDHDLLALDEVTELKEDQVRFIQAWVRTVIPGQQCTVIMSFNPPRKREGMWVIKYFAPWLDVNHPNPALPGEKRWFAIIDGQDVEVSDNRPFILGEDENEFIYDFNPNEYSSIDIIKPESRVFIPARVTDNVFLDDRYIRKLQALPEPLRSQMLRGDFQYEFDDDPMQVIPAQWVEEAMARWELPRNSRFRPDSPGSREHS